jgi:glycosyltransferase involved in cell wall biosynthesis
MRLGVNALRLSGQRLGIGRYIEYLVKYWEQFLLPDDRVTLYVREHMNGNQLQVSDKFEIKPLRPKLTGVLWEHFMLPAQAKEMDVLFCPSYTMPLNYRGKCVVATHSVNEVQKGTHPWWYNLTYQPRYRLSALKADKVIVPSASAKSHVQEFYGVAADRIEIVPEGAPGFFEPIEDETVLRETRERYLGANQPYILFVGKLSQRRNIPALLTAFSMLKKEGKIPHKLLLFGPNVLNLPLDKIVAELGIQDSIVQTDGKLKEHKDIIPIYSAADLYVFPSSYEGFSITLVEAMACGLPVITVNRGATLEIAHECALMVDDPTPEKLAEAMQKALSTPSLRQELRAKGLERARLYRYEDTARLTLDLLRRVAQT